MKDKYVFLLSLLLVAAGALAFRLPLLDGHPLSADDDAPASRQLQPRDRPMHADEAVQAVRFRKLWLTGQYVYDPNEFHGPTLNYATLPSVWIGRYSSFADTTEATYRIVPVLFGAGLILLLWLLGDAVGKPAVLCAAVLTAISPAMVFYSRYYIHETLFVFFMLATIVAGWRYVRSGKLAWCLTTGACLGLVQATKETSALVFAAMFFALLLTALANRISPCNANDRPPRFPRWHLLAGLGVAILVAVVLLSSFFTNPRGPLDGILTYIPWLKRAGGESPHVHSWYFYLRILTFWQVGNGPRWSEGLIVALAAAGFVVGLLPVRYNLLPNASVPFVRWTGFYTLLLTAAYTAIPYKTPWCLLGFLHAMILMAAVGAVALVRLVPTLPLKGLAALVLLTATGQLAWQSYRASYLLPDNLRNPYVYAHTLPDIKRLGHDVEQICLAAPEGRAVLVKIIWDDNYYRPLPWYLRRLERVEPWNRMPSDPAAPIVISAVTHDPALSREFEDTHLMTGYYGVRPEVFALLWVRQDLWEAHLKRLGRL